MRLTRPGAQTCTAGTIMGAVQKYVLSELDTGERVISERVPGVRSVAIGFWIGAGSRDEIDAKAGISHFIEHLLFKGSQRYSAQELVHDLFSQAVFGRHALGRPVIGTADVISSVTPRVLASYHRQMYAGANVVIAAAG